MDEDEFPAGPDVPGQAESRAARSALEHWLTEQTELPAWFALWEELAAERTPIVGPDGEPQLNAKGEVRTKRRWDWRKALFIAWSSVPKSKREPKTLEQFASLLGLSSTGTIRNWRAHDPGIAERIAELPKSLLMGHVVDVYDALVTVATMHDPRAFNDRRLFLELAGQYAPKGSVTLTGADDGPVGIDMTYGIRNLSDDDLETLDRIASRLAGGANRVGQAPAD